MISLILSSGRRRIRYENRRTYDIDFNTKGQKWVDWMVEITHEALRVCSGVIAWVVCGQTENFKYSCTPELLTADLHRAGVCVRRPLLYVRDGIPGSGGPDWFSNKYEFIICCTKERGKLPWSDPLALGHKPKYKRGGAYSHRMRDGKRSPKKHNFQNPEKANPGNLIDCGAIGSVNMGSKLANLGEAPYPVKVPDFLIRSLCPPDGWVYDPFCGSGTTMQAAILAGRNCIGTDIRRSQVILTRRRIKQAFNNVGFGLST